MLCYALFLLLLGLGLQTEHVQHAPPDRKSDKNQPSTVISEEATLNPNEETALNPEPLHQKNNTHTHTKKKKKPPLPKPKAQPPSPPGAKSTTASATHLAGRRASLLSGQGKWTKSLPANAKKSIGLGVKESRCMFRFSGSGLPGLGLFRVLGFRVLGLGVKE